MLNNKTLLSKKRSRQNTKSNIYQNDEKDSPMFELNGYNIIELLYTESLSRSKYLGNYILNSEESNFPGLDYEENKEKIKDLLTRTKLKEIEEYYISQFGIKQINENCCVCLMNNFLSNELLYFSSRQNLFNYCKYCFVNKSKKIFLNEIICNKNKEQFFSTNQNFVNSWRFFIPKTICKGCFMHLINKKDIIYDIKKYFSDTDEDSSCKTNYRNYAKFSKLFRREFNIGIKKNKNKKKSVENTHMKKKEKIETIEISDSETVDINTSIKNQNIDNKKYNQLVEYDQIKDIILIDKSILKNNDIIENKKEEIKGKNNKLKKKNNIIIKRQKSNPADRINNIITFQGQNYINIINHININADNSINNNIIIQNYIELMTDMIKNSLLEFDKFKICLQNLKDSIFLIYSYIEEATKKLFILLIYKVLLNFSDISKTCNYLLFNFEDKKNSFDLQLFNLKKSFEKSIDFTDNIYNKIESVNFIDENEKNQILTKIKIMKLSINENILFFDLYTKPINNFIANFYCLLNLIYQITNSIP